MRVTIASAVVTLRTAALLPACGSSSVDYVASACAWLSVVTCVMVRLCERQVFNLNVAAEHVVRRCHSSMIDGDPSTRWMMMMMMMMMFVGIVNDGVCDDMFMNPVMMRKAFELWAYGSHSDMTQRRSVQLRVSVLPMHACSRDDDMFMVICS